MQLVSILLALAISAILGVGLSSLGLRMMLNFMSIKDNATEARITSGG